MRRLFPVLAVCVVASLATACAKRAQQEETPASTPSANPASASVTTLTPVPTPANGVRRLNDLRRVNIVRPQRLAAPAQTEPTPAPPASQ